VVIYADDLGYGDLQCYNPQRGKIPTPNIDRLAAEGMRFTDGHSSSGVCSPSRYTLLTGRYHWRTRLQAGIVGLWGEPLIAPDRLTIAGLAQQQGYRTACVGKWHLGWDWPIPDQQAELFKERPEGEAVATDAHRAVWERVFSQPIPGGPTTRGFDSYFGTDVPNWPPYCFIENNRTQGIPRVFLPARLLGNNQASLQGPALPDWTLEPILPALGDRAVAWIEQQANHPEPFLLCMPLTSPHTPLSVNEQWKGRSGLNLYADFVMETDAVVGRVLAALAAAKVADNTLVVFTSDNGCAPYIGIEELEQKGHYPSGPLRGYKSDAWEGGHRVPFIVRWPGVVQGGSRCDQLVQQADLIATFAAVLGLKLPDNAGEDSFNLLPLLLGEDRPVREHAVNCSMTGVPSVRQGPWKLILASGSGGWTKGGDESQPLQLYNLVDDLGETKNLAAEQPERVAAMQQLLEKIITDGRSTPGAAQKNDVTVRRYPLQVAEPVALLLDSPVDYQVFQRQTPRQGTVRVSGRVPTGTEKLEMQIDADWQAIEFNSGDGAFDARVEVSAGGWYVCRVRAMRSGEVLATAEVPHVGVGELFVVAGQSNSANHGEERLHIQTGLVAAFDGQHWQLAHDPQPGASGAGGSFLPPFSDAIAEHFRIPVGIVACGIGATSVREWLPQGSTFPHPPTLVGRVQQRADGQWESKGEAFAMFIDRLKPLGPHGFRAVLWHQGESDANQSDPTRTLPGQLYRQYLEQLIRDSRREIGWDAPWFVAQVSYHVPGDEASPDIRAAQKSLWDDGIALEGPDSDALKGKLREQDGRGVHFSGEGLRAHAARWAEKVVPWLETQRE
jgi:arylsulfatase A-like enzyme